MYIRIYIKYSLFLCTIHLDALYFDVLFLSIQVFFLYFYLPLYSTGYSNTFLPMYSVIIFVSKLNIIY